LVSDSRRGFKNVDWVLTLVPLGIILSLFLVFMFFPSASKEVVQFLRDIFVGELGFFYMIFGLGMLGLSIWLAFSPYGDMKLGNIEKPRFNSFAWGAMIFTSTMAADILYWSLIEWAYYFNSMPFGIEDMSLVEKQAYSSTYPLFHWGPIPWSFYILPAVAYGYMFFVKRRNRQTLSEACRSTIGDKADSLLGKTIDVFAIVGVLSGIATTFSLATPLLSLIISSSLGIADSTKLTIWILIFIALVYTIAVLIGLKGISSLANISVVMFSILLIVFLFSGPTIYIIESGISSMGRMIDEFFSMATWMDPLRLSGEGGSGFPQDWTIFYWAYWISWSVATPFFIGKISEGRTIKNTILGGYFYGLSGTFTSFIVFGNYGLFQQVTGKMDAANMLSQGVAPSRVILKIMEPLPMNKFVMILLAFTMVAFYASTFDAITLVISEYSIKELKKEEESSRYIRMFWSAVLIILPIALIFNESTLSMLQTLSIIAAFPVALITILIIYSFLKDIRGEKKMDRI